MVAGQTDHLRDTQPIAKRFGVFELLCGGTLGNVARHNQGIRFFVV